MLIAVWLCVLHPDSVNGVGVKNGKVVNGMTLREKVTQERPECIGEDYIGGVEGCPCVFDFLDVDESEMDECPMNKNGTVITCFDCWNREYKPQE
jgi:hypothetical protein